MDALSFQGRTCTTADQKLDISAQKNMLSLARGKIEISVNMQHEKVLMYSWHYLLYILHVNFSVISSQGSSCIKISGEITKKRKN